jgi:hypothetical protein
VRTIRDPLAGVVFTAPPAVDLSVVDARTAAARVGAPECASRRWKATRAMREFSTAGEQAILDLAQRHGFSPGAVSSMLQAVRAGRGRMAQFRHPEFGGSGQWMRGGMTMVGDMFDSALKARVERLCDELSLLLASEPDPGENVRPGAAASLFVGDSAVATSSWWPGELGQPNSTGEQNGTRYAYFAAPRRLAIEVGGRVTVYDTLDHRIGGAAQQQSGSGTLTFMSQHGVVDITVLPEVSQAPAAAKAESAQDVVATIERLAELRARGILTEAEFTAKKTELLARL